MRKITKLLTLALAALMIMGAMPVSAAFTDVSVENEALYEAVELLSTLGVAKGTTDTTFGKFQNAFAPIDVISPFITIDVICDRCCSHGCVSSV